jgi:uncharacterized protein YijF (DUF1287 family)
MRARLSLLLATLLLLAPLAWAQESAETVARAARAQVGVTLFYAPAYARIRYPMGDLPIDRGVCTDVVVRAFRAAGVDLQARVHEDMRRNFRAYPQKWGLKQPDSNIDHRRVPNLQRWFQRQGKALPVSANAADYRAGDVVSWKLPNGLDHIGVVSAQRSRDGARPMVVHNIGAGAQEEDVLFAWRQTGHYRAFPPTGGAAR